MLRVAHDREPLLAVARRPARRPSRRGRRGGSPRSRAPRRPTISTAAGPSSSRPSSQRARPAPRRRRGRRRRAAATPASARRRARRRAPRVPSGQARQQRDGRRERAQLGADGRDHQRPLSSTPADANVAISSRIASEAPQQRQRERGAAALAEPQLEVEQRLQPERLEHDARARARTSGARRSASRAAPARAQRRRARPTTPGSRRRARARHAPPRPSAMPGEHAELEPAHGGERHRRDRTARRLVGASARVTTSRLRARPSSSRPVPRPQACSGVGSRERTAERGGGRRVADAHLAERDDPRPAEFLLGQRDARLERRDRLLARHRRPVQHARRAGAETAVEHARHRQRLGDAAIDDDETSRRRDAPATLTAAPPAA